MCWFCYDIEKFINKSVVVYDDTTAKVSKNYSYPDATVTLKITAGGYRGDSHILMGMLELKDLKYCPNCGEKIEDFDNCASKETDKNTCEIEKLKMDVEDLKKHHNDIANLYERLAKGGIECTMTVDDENGIYTIYSHGRRVSELEEKE